MSLDAASYDELTAAPREYSVSVVLTALGDAVKCGPCKCVPQLPLLLLLAEESEANPNCALQDPATRIRPDRQAVEFDQEG